MSFSSSTPSIATHLTRIVLIMGVAGSGKTTIGKRLAQSLSWQFADADDFHSAANIAKMRQGVPLTDVDRQPWLLTLQAAIARWLQDATPTVLACSALKASYRNLLTQGDDRVQVVYLAGSAELIQQRLQQRQGHYMNPNLLHSQLDTLEVPTTGLQVSIDQSPAAIVKAIENFLKPTPPQ
jgi:gluconokinase